MDKEIGEVVIGCIFFCGLFMYALYRIINYTDNTTTIVMAIFFGLMFITGCIRLINEIKS